MKMLIAVALSVALASTLSQSHAQDVKGAGGEAKSAEKEGEVVAVKVGEKAPDFELESLGNTTVKLSERFGEKGKPVVLLFSRAHW